MEKKLELRDLKHLQQQLSSLTAEYNKKLTPKTKIILLIGSTGAGKSTFFNFLCGAEFVSKGIEIELKHTSDQYSRMQGGLVSVTKEPKFYLNSSNNHLLIDFPGFQDTTGILDQLLFDLLFNKIVSMGEVKILYVIKNPDNSLPQRGSDLQGFIQQLENPNFNLLLNCYLDDLEDQELINNIKKELVEVNLQTKIDQIIVQRKAKKNNIDQLFNHNTRQIFWNQINEMTNVQIKPRMIPNSNLISGFLISQTTKKILENANIMLNFFSQKTNESMLQSEEMLENLILFKVLMQNKKGFTALKWFEEFIKICGKLTNSDDQKSSEITTSKDLMEVLQFFEQFKEFINGYEELQTINQIAKQNFKQIELLIDTKIELIKKWKQAEQEKQKAEQEKQKAEQEKQKAEQEKQKAEQEKRQAEQEKRQAEEEKQKAEQEKQKAEQEKQKAEQEKQKAEQEKQKAEQEKQKAEKEKRQAEEERQKAEKEKQQAEEERQKAEKEKQQAQQERQKAEKEKQQAQEERWKAEQQAEQERENARQKAQQERENARQKAQQERQQERQQAEFLRKQQQIQIEIFEKQQRENKIREREKFEEARMLEILQATLFYEDCQNKLKRLEEEKNDYIIDQQKLFSLLVSGDWEKDKQRKIENFNQNIEAETILSNKALLYLEWLKK